MHNIDVKDILTKLFNHSPTVQKGGDELLFYCPKCKHYKKKLSINTLTGYYHCWIDCGFGGKGFYSLLKKLKAHPRYYSLLNVKKKTKNLVQKDDVKLSLPEDFYPLYKKPNDILHKHALSYCLKRGISKLDILRYNIGYCKNGNFRNRVIIPSYDKDLNLNFYCGRDFYDGYMKYRLCESTKNIVGFESFINFKHGVTIVEGVFDALSVRYNAIPLFGKRLSDNLKLKLILEQPSRVNVLLDNDAFSDSLKICEFLLQNGISAHLVTLHGKDPNQLGFKDTWTRINNTPKLTESVLFRHKINNKII